MITIEQLKEEKKQKQKMLKELVDLVARTSLQINNLDKEIKLAKKLEGNIKNEN